MVHVNPAAESYAIAAKGGGDLNAVHSSSLPKAGTDLKVTVAELANGTYLQKGGRESLGQSDTAKLTGVVTFRDLQTGGYTLSKRGISMLIGPPEVTDGPIPDRPQVGDYVEVGVRIEPASPPRPRRAGFFGSLPGLARLVSRPAQSRASAADASACSPDSESVPPPDSAARGSLTQTSLKVKDHFTYSDFEGIVISCPETGRLLLSADDVRESGQDISLMAARGIDLARLDIGDSVAVTGTIDDQGRLTLTGAASDEGASGADDAASGQGDLAG
ncbi:MAG: hypothetical protein U0R52_07750 [Solirubrobacterales bacterium]